MVDKRQNEIIGRYEECKRIADKFGLQITARDYLRIERNGTVLYVFTQIDNVYLFLCGYQFGKEDPEETPSPETTCSVCKHSRLYMGTYEKRDHDDESMHCERFDVRVSARALCELFEPPDYDDPNPKPKQSEPLVPESEKRCGKCRLSLPLGKHGVWVYCSKHRSVKRFISRCGHWTPKQDNDTKPIMSIS